LLHSFDDAAMVFGYCPAEVGHVAILPGLLRRGFLSESCQSVIGGITTDGQQSDDHEKAVLHDFSSTK
jgi:hypothetical protein